MPITSKPSIPPRARVIVVGTVDSAEWEAAEEAFKRRGYQLEHASALDTRTWAQGTDSFIVLHSQDRRGEVASFLAENGSALLDEDCRIYVRSPDPAYSEPMVAMMMKALTELPSGHTDAAYSTLTNEAHQPRVQICANGTTWDEFAQLVALHQAGPSPSMDLQIVGGILSASEEVLVRRAFHDCSRVELVAMTDGLSGVSAYRAFATVQEGMLGPSPYSYFVKVGNRGKIVTEAEKYRGNALAYVPFHLGPRLIERRCGLGAKSGILVGDLVSDCLTLRDCAKFAGVSAIASLFNRTLKAWHDTSREESASLANLLAPRLENRTDVPEDRLQIAKDLGATRSYEVLRGVLQQRSRQEKVRLGAIHGDLHATNVMVRGFDAVLIDFERQENDQPLLFDPASLEGGLLVDGFCGDPRTVKEILASIRPLYTGDLLAWQAPSEAATQSEWYYDCVRQIRLHARHLECAPGQYATALACTLLSKSANGDTRLAGERRKHELRAAAYALADLILSKALP